MLFHFVCLFIHLFRIGLHFLRIHIMYLFLVVSESQQKIPIHLSKRLSMLICNSSEQAVSKQ